jgi:hypothetical protein
MSAYTRSEGPYKSSRPTPQGKRVVRLSGNMGRAVRVIRSSDAAELSDFICTIISLGMCVSFTGTSDGGAISIVVFDGDTRWKAYGRDEDQLLTSFRDLAAAIRGEE